MVNWKHVLPPIVLVVVIFGVSYGVYLNSEILNNSPDEPLIGCRPLSVSGEPRNNVDIVFIPDNYDNLTEFVEKARVYKDTFLQLSPYDQYTDRFNFYLIDRQVDLECTYNEAVICDNTKVKNSAVLCPHDYEIVLTDIDGIKKLTPYLRSSSWYNAAHLNTRDNDLVFPHEFGHAFADFADEYSYAGPITWDAPNCDSFTETCPKFQVVDGYGCFVGCSDLKNSRSVWNGIMNDYNKEGGQTYGAYDEYVLNNLINRNTKSSNVGEPKLSPQDIYLVDVSCQNEDCSITEIRESKGFPDGNNYEDAFSIKVQDNIGNYASVGNAKLFKDGQGSFNVEYPESYRLTLALPKTDEVENFDLYLDEVLQDKYYVDQKSVGPRFNGGKVIDIPETSLVSTSP